MKEFMLIFIGGNGNQAGLSPDQMQAQMGKWYTWIDDLRKKDIYVEGRPLEPAGKTVKGKQPVITDGPFAESKELVGGYFIIKASSIDEASTIAKESPGLEIGGVVQVREVRKM